MRADLESAPKKLHVDDPDVEGPKAPRRIRGGIRKNHGDSSDVNREFVIKGNIIGAF